MNCKFCDKEIKQKDHTHELYCKKNPNRKTREGHQNPMFGKKGSNHYVNGAVCSENTRRILSEKSKKRIASKKTREKISESRLKFLFEHPDKVPFLMNHSSEMSYPEKIFKNALEAEKIKGWEYNFVNGIYKYDFAFPDLKIDVEIDGGTHDTEKVKRIDERRDKFSKEQGWLVIRFPAKKVKENVVECINELKKFLTP